MRLPRALLLVAVPAALFAAACAPADQSAGSDSSSAAPSGSPSAAACATDALALKTAGRLTVGTDSPAYEPWFSNNEPSNGKGFESAVTYAVAKQLGFDKGQVTWVKVPFNSSYAPGAKKFDFDINQISITPARAKVVDFSHGYYSAAQGVIAMKGSKGGSATSLADLKGLRLGAQTGTTSLTAINDVIQPTQKPLVFDDTNAAKQALLNDQVDAIVTDLPTAFFITSAEIENSTIVGQFQPETGHTEEFGMLLEKGSGLVRCVNQALTKLRDSGKLAAIEKRWLSDVVDVPVLK
jgi:polar amino acid transport system substrate-binding protein